MIMVLRRENTGKNSSNSSDANSEILEKKKETKQVFQRLKELIDSDDMSSD